MTLPDPPCTPNTRRYATQTTAAKQHRWCCRCGKAVEKGEALVTITEFDPITRRGGRNRWKRHETCPPLEGEIMARPRRKKHGQEG